MINILQVSALSTPAELRVTFVTAFTRNEQLLTGAQDLMTTSKQHGTKTESNSLELEKGVSSDDGIEQDINGGAENKRDRATTEEDGKTRTSYSTEIDEPLNSKIVNIFISPLVIYFTGKECYCISEVIPTSPPKSSCIVRQMFKVASNTLYADVIYHGFTRVKKWQLPQVETCP